MNSTPLETITTDRFRHRLPTASAPAASTAAVRPSLGLRAVGLLALAIVSLVLVPAARAQSVWHVDDDASANGDGLSWGTAFRYLQDALDVATNGAEIHVAGGTYRPDQDEGGNVTSGDREATFQLINGHAIRGGYAGIGAPDPDVRDVAAYETILSGDLARDDGPLYVEQFSACFSGTYVPPMTGCGGFDQDGDDDVDYDDQVLFLAANHYGENNYHVMTGSGADSTAVLDGFTITAGNADGSDATNDSGGGMYNHDGSPTLTNCTFTGNCAMVGGGVFNENDSSPMLTNCTFSVNSAGYFGGGMNNFVNSSPTLSNCTFSGNSAGDCGGGMFNPCGSPPKKLLI